MRFTELPIAGAYSVAPEPNEDERGFFARIWSSSQFAELGLAASLAESSLSLTPRQGTLRGLHYQARPHEEVKYVTCVRGSIWDVIVDLRIESPTFRQWHGTRLDGAGLTALYVPKGVAHGFLTLSDDALVLYQISERHDPDAARGVRWNDPAFGIEWPAAPTLIGARDQSFADFEAT